jgi:cytochrome b pre-mRNA-processing protein 3
MLRFLFPRLTPARPRGAELFAAVTAQARVAHWYRGGGVPDTIDGRFRVLATVAALAIVRLERDGPDGDAASAALTERFIDAMETEHREIGLGDPSLGKQVRRLVGALARRAALWRDAVAETGGWDAAVTDSLYGDAPLDDACKHSAAALRRLWVNLEQRSLAQLMEGAI